MASSMGWIGGIVDLIFGLGSSYENAKMSRAWERSARGNSGQVMALGQKMLDNAAQDWDHFKTTFAPAEQALATYAGRDPDYAGAEGKVSDAVASGMSQGGNAAVRRRINPNSGATSAKINDLTVAGGRAGGIGMGQARRGEENRLFRERAAISDASGSILGMSALTSARGLDTLQTTIKHTARVGDVYGRDAADSLYQAGSGAGKAWSERPRSGSYSSPDYNRSGSPDYTWGSKGDADYFNSQNEAFGMSASFADGGSVVALGGRPGKTIELRQMYNEYRTEMAGSADAPKDWPAWLDDRGYYLDKDNLVRPKYADGGIVRGPGTGRSDSVPAMIDGEQPARVSNGEIIIPARLVRKIGKHRLDELVARFHKPSGPRVIDGTATRVQFANGGRVRGYGMRAPVTGIRIHRQMPVHG